MDTSLRIKLFSGLFLAVGLIVIATAWGFEIIGGYQPCALCLEQRTPYYVGLPLATVSIIAAMKLQNLLFARILLILAGVSMLYGAGLGIQHAGVEWGFWSGPSECSGGGSMVDNASSMISALKTTTVVSCSEASWRFLGLSFAGWNAVTSVGLVILAFWGCKAAGASDSQKPNQNEL